LVRGVVGDLFGDQRAALLTGRTQPKKASFRLGRRESILTHETRSSVLVALCSVSPPRTISSPHTSPAFHAESSAEPPVSFRAAPAVVGSFRALPSRA